MNVIHDTVFKKKHFSAEDRRSYRESLKRLKKFSLLVLKKIFIISLH